MTSDVLTDMTQYRSTVVNAAVKLVPSMMYNEDMYILSILLRQCSNEILIIIMFFISLVFKNREMTSFVYQPLNAKIAIFIHT